MSSEKTIFASLTEKEKESIVSDKDSLKTKQATKYAVSTFRQYLLEKGCDENFEDFDIETLDQKLRNFYSELRSTKGESYKRSTIIAIRGGIARHLSSKRQLDIVRGGEFKSSCDMFVYMLKAVSREGKGGVDHKQPISSTDIDKLYKSMALDPSTPTGLMQKVWFELCIFFCRRGRENQRELTPEMFEIRRDEADGTEYAVQKDPVATKNHQGINRAVNDNQVRMYAKPGNIMCPVTSFKKYMSKRNPECSAFFQRPRDSFNDEDETWYQNKPLGKNTLGQMMSHLSSEANLSYIYTNHCIRATAITALSDAGFETRKIMTMSGHRNEASVRSYISDTTATQKRQMSEALCDLTTKMVENTEPQCSSNELNDGFDDALCLSLSQTEKVLQSIYEFESNSNAQPPQPSNMNANSSALPADNVVHDVVRFNQEVSITNKNNVKIATNNSLPPVFNFNSCSVQFFNMSK